MKIVAPSVHTRFYNCYFLDKVLKNAFPFSFFFYHDHCQYFGSWNVFSIPVCSRSCYKQYSLEEIIVSRGKRQDRVFRCLLPKQIVAYHLERSIDDFPRLLLTRFLVRPFTFGGFLGIGLWFTPLGESTRLLAGSIAVRLQIVRSRHLLIHASAPRALLVSASFFALLLDSLGYLAGPAVSLFKIQRTGPCVGFRVAFRPLTLHVSARRSAAGCSFFGAANSSHKNFRVIFLPEIRFRPGCDDDGQQSDTR